MLLEPQRNIFQEIYAGKTRGSDIATAAGINPNILDAAINFYIRAKAGDAIIRMAAPSVTIIPPANNITKKRLNSL